MELLIAALQLLTGQHTLFRGSLHYRSYGRDDAEVTCEGFSFYDGVKCSSFLTLVPGWELKWDWLTGVCLFAFSILTLLLLNRMAGIHMKYRRNTIREIFTLRNLMVWSCIVGAIGCILMGVAYIDGWAFAGRLTVSAYLGVYPVAYSFIPLSVVLLQLHFLDKSFLAHFGKFGVVKKTYTVGTLVIAGLFALYASFGFIGFGQKLRVEFLKDPKTPLGAVGNHIIGALYGGIIVLCVIAMGPVIWKSYVDMTDDPKRVKNTGRLTSWTIATVFIAGANLCNLYLWTYTKQVLNQVSPYMEDGILPIINTMEMLEWNRIFEIAFIVNNLVLMGGDCAEVFPLENLFFIWYSNGREQGSRNTRGTYSSASASGSRSNTNNGDIESPRSVDPLNKSPSPGARRSDYSRKPKAPVTSSVEEDSTDSVELAVIQ